MGKITVKLSNPGTSIELEVSDEAILGLFTDMAGVKEGLEGLRQDFAWLCRLGLGCMAGGFGLMGVLMVIL